MDDSLKRTVLDLWADIAKLQKALGRKIPPRVVRLTDRANEVLAHEWPELQTIYHTDEERRPPPTADLLCPDCGGACRLLIDTVPGLDKPTIYCPACEWTGRAPPGMTAVRVGAHR